MAHVLFCHNLQWFGVMASHHSLFSYHCDSEEHRLHQFFETELAFLFLAKVHIKSRTMAKERCGENRFV